MASHYRMPDSYSWVALTPRFEDFLDRLRPGEAETSALRAPVADLEHLFRRRFWRQKAAPAESVILTGGIGKDTALHTSGSADALLVMPNTAAPPPQRQGASRAACLASDPALSELLALFSARFGAVTTARDGTIEIRLGKRTGEARRTVRLTPAYPRPHGGFLVRRPCEAAGHFVWQARDPHAEAASVDEADRLGCGKARDLIRMLKAWRLAAAVPIAPFALELLACRFVSTWLYRQRSVLFYDWMLRDLFFWLTANAGVAVPVPGGEVALPVGSAWLPHAQAAHDHAAAAAVLERDNDVAAATAHWRAIFGCAFPATMAVAATPAAASLGRPEGVARLN